MKTENGKCVVQFEILSQGMFTLYIYFKDVLNPLIQENLQSYIGAVKRNIQECQSHWDEVKSFASTVLPQQQVSPAFLKVQSRRKWDFLGYLANGYPLLQNFNIVIFT